METSRNDRLYVPVFSAVVVIVLGLLMTGASLGWIQLNRIIG